ncbi:LVIVD repeat-containing protein [Streptomyces sp. enrichment culture]|uniref:LVIVD repeat-containing protein n=1 Tax=Streptomyces sp. enrichment culture TaxID=1795815 RepID=UPI003F574091
MAASTPAPVLSRGFVPVGHSDQGGRPDAMQVQYHRDHVYVGHLFSGGFSVLDARSPRDLPVRHFEPAPPGTWNIHLQAADDLLLVVHAKDLWAEFRDESQYYVGSVGSRLAGTARTWSAGVAVYDIADPARPRRVSFLPVDGIGVHRLWYTGGRWAYASVLPDGYTDYVFAVIDLADPVRPRWAGRWHLPGMHTAGGETPGWDTAKWRYALHHAIVHGDTAYASWRDGGLTLLDISDRETPRLIAHRTWSPPYGGGTHTALPLPGRELLVVADEAVADRLADGTKHVWMFDIREPVNPVSIATFPQPAEEDYGTKGGHFGPHNLHENRPGTFVSEYLVFATYQNAGLRAVDITDPYRPLEVGAFVPGAPGRLVDPRPGRPRVVQTADVTVTDTGLVFLTDYNAGLYVAQYEGI